MPKRPSNFDKNVFINCPFDDLYTPIFHAIIFTVHDLGFRPRCALEASNAGVIRIDKIMDILSECKYSIHDLSRTELDKTTKLPRFNMPLELGLDLGCRKFGNSHHKEKISLVLDIEPHRYEMFISDIKGQDIYAHSNDEKQAIEVVRNWLRTELDPKSIIIPSGADIFQRYQIFQYDLPSICSRLHWTPKQLPFADFSYTVAAWITANPL